MLLLILLSITSCVQGAIFTDPVNTTQGLIRGIVAEDGYYSMYLGVPYAKVNEANPFGASVPHPGFDGIFDAIDDSVVCPQQEEFNQTIVGTLDCLHLNIFVPNTSSVDTKLPVLFYVYGGGFTFGFSRTYIYGPKFLVKHDIILVVVNYRVGPYGFMCLDTEDIPGNQGLKDQHLALKWIYENIDSFGGDANRITISGNSAGAMSVDFHLLTELPKFYKQAILQSGCGLNPFTLFPTNKTVPFKIAEHLGYTTNDLQEAISFLANTHTDLVIAATLELGIGFRPCVEKEFNYVDRFIDMHPEHKNLSSINNIKIIVGYNSHELMLFNVVETLFSDTIMTLFNIDDMDDMINKVKRFYIGDGMINQTELLPDIVDFVSDFHFNHPIQRTVVRYVESGAQVFQYMFSYSGERNFVKSRTNIIVDGALHADEISYLFDMGLFPETPTLEDQLMIDRMTTMWANFVKYGNPTPTTSDLLPVTWIPATRDVISHLEISSELMSMGTRPYYSRSSFWDLFYAANQDNLLANINYGTASTASRFSLPLILISVCGIATYLLRF